MSTYETQMRTLTALQAENAALKEQVEQLELIKDEHDERGIDIVFLVQNLNSVEAKLTTLHSKSAALVDALEALLSWVDAYAETSDAEFPDVEDKCNAALADFKGAK